MKNNFFLNILIFLGLYFVLTSGACVDMVSFTAPNVVTSGQNFQTTIAAKNKLNDSPWSFPVFTHLSYDSLYNPEDILIGEDKINNLPPLNIGSKDITCKINPNTPAGEYYLIGRSDINRPDAFMFEDYKFKKVYVNGPVATGTDLVLSNLRVTGSFLAGQPMTCKFNLHNKGPVAAGKFKMRCRLITPIKTYGLQDFIVESMPGNSTRNYEATFNIPGNVPPGNYTLTVIADLYNEVTESNKLNNGLSLVPLTVKSSFTGNPAEDRAPDAAIFSDQMTIEPALSASPNPATGPVRIAIAASPFQKTTIEVRNISGKLLESAPVSCDAAGQLEHTFDTGNLPNGIYLLSAAIAGKNRITQKLVVQH